MPDYYGVVKYLRDREIIDDMITFGKDVLSGKVKGKENPDGFKGLNLVVSDYGVRINSNENSIK